MPLATIITGVAIDIAKKYLFEAGKKVAHEFVDSATGKKTGVIISYRKKETNNNVILFVHGFAGSASETFGVTPDLLVNDHHFDGWDVFSIGYSTDAMPSIGKGLWSVNPNITKIAMNLNTLLDNQFQGYERIAFVGHSMGGLAIQRTILQAGEQIQNKLSHVIFFGTPSAGLKKAGWAKFWNTQLHDLDQKSKFISDLRADWNKKFTIPYRFIFKSIAGSKDEFVPVDSSLSPLDESCRGVIEGNHITMVKPVDINDITNQSFQIILKTLTAQHVEYLHGNPEDINLLLGEYQTVINKFLPNVQGLAKEPLVRLVFALECTGRKAEALQILNDHPLAKANTDIMGIIGGRYKRSYLLSGLQKDLDFANDYYKKALTIAADKNDKPQIFYHAINLAFLGIAGQRDVAANKSYAALALDNCKMDTTYMWELAIIAEANMYLGNIEEAKNFYEKAAKYANVRDRESMYSNAFYGYRSLNALNGDTSAFIKFLDDSFLRN